MIDVFGSIRTLIKLDAVRIDNNCFRMHYKLTTIMLIAFSMLVTSRQFAGNAIRCLANGIPSEMMESYCWTYSTFTVKNMPAVESGAGYAKPSQLRYHTYYQWVSFVLFAQAALFYVPRYVWKAWEGGRMQMLCADLMEIGREQETAVTRKKDAVVNYFLNNLRARNSYVYHLFACELLNAANVLAQICFIDLFLGGKFRSYGLRVLTKARGPDSVFPKMTKCTFYKYGSSGTLQQFDGLCVLPLNIVNEKVYAFLWFWFAILLGVSVYSICHRSATFLSPYLRRRLLTGNLFARHPQNSTRTIVEKLSLSNWYMLHQLGENINPLLFTDIVLALTRKLNGDDDETGSHNLINIDSRHPVT